MAVDNIARGMAASALKNQGGGGSSLPIVNTAAIGQTIRVSAVDDAGKPTEWEAVEFPAGGENVVGEQTLLAEAVIYAGTPAESDTDLGVSMESLREWKRFGVTFKNGTSANFGLAVKGRQDAPRLIYLGQVKINAVFEWVDSERTILQVMYNQNTGYQTDGNYIQATRFNGADSAFNATTISRLKDFSNFLSFDVSAYNSKETTEDVSCAIHGILKYKED